MMIDQKKIQLALEHARLTALHAIGERKVLQRLREIESELQMQPQDIAQIAIDNYLSDY